MRPRTFWTWCVLLPGLTAAALAFMTQIHNEDGDPLLCTSCYVGGHHHHASECAPWRSIVGYARAQAAYFKTDPDGKNRNEYWRKDVAGLWSTPGINGVRIGLLWMPEAFSDEKPAGDLSQWGLREPRYGYLLRTMLHADESSPSPQRFAGCSYPVKPVHGKWTYIVDEKAVVYRKELPIGGAPKVYPLDPIAEGWKRFRELP